MGRPSEETRYLALFDILAFSHAIETSLDKVVKFLGSTDQLTGLLSHRDGLRSFWNREDPEDRRSNLLRFSDTILIYQDGSEAEDLVDLLVTSMGVFTVCQQYGFPLRGVLTRGQLYVSPDEEIYVGEALVRAHRLEQAQNWSGAFIETDAIPPAHGQTLDRLRGGGMVIPYRVPMKRGEVRERDTLAWPAIKAASEETVRSNLLKHADVEALGWNAYQKIRNTIAFWRYYKERYGSAVRIPTESGELGKQFEVAEELGGEAVRDPGG